MSRVDERGDEVRFDGRVVVVTGGGRGLGREYALLLAARGAQVVVNDVGTGTDGHGTSPAPARAVVEEIRAAGGQAHADGHDVASADGARALTATALERWGRLDALVNNAGISILRPLAELTDDECRRVLDTHAGGTLNMLRAVWPHMAAAGYGRIVNTCSDALFGDTGLSAYAAGKGAVLGLTTSAAAEGAAYGIKVNAVVPVAATRMSLEAVRDDERTTALLTDLFPARHVAPVVALLAHEGAPCTGRLLHAAGRRTARIFLGATEGVVWPEDPTPETVRAGFPRICATETFRTPGSVSESMGFSLARLGAGSAGPPALDLTTPAARE
ncbi:putative short-chain dehydrogenase/reductase [Streptomyces capoamus]|uniref:Short-chain dehydrogenase/reductase n=1 Tax=Streptomyces capoamus TaxID=68183 RepID=A0A919C176_9ACTN|nr:SDR family NAD(P)-dependent oxidoreductase [Streptomyces capoamus]GGW13721.1 putative short-chain dehydrogenase/reductase [Streptomyces libani subsp. rufus]GHG41037.1 putative short-chain dehydrogenase/reductase [Streptomyces capoamus]